MPGCKEVPSPPVPMQVVEADGEDNIRGGRGGAAVETTDGKVIFVPVDVLGVDARQARLWKDFRTGYFSEKWKVGLNLVLFLKGVSGMSENLSIPPTVLLTHLVASISCSDANGFSGFSSVTRKGNSRSNRTRRLSRSKYCRIEEFEI
jgi:hypothetical protein